MECNSIVLIFYMNLHIFLSPSANQRGRYGDPNLIPDKIFPKRKDENRINDFRLLQNAIIERNFCDLTVRTRASPALPPRLKDPMPKTRLEPPDGGWGWVVAVASAFIYFLSFSLMISHGVLMVPLMQHFGVGRTEMTWIPIIPLALSRLIAPVSSIMSVRLTHRVVVFTGGLLMTIGYAMGSLAESMVHLYLTVGLTVGLGAGMIVFPASILTSQYFTSHISLANGLYTAGASMGSIVGPLLTEFLLEYGGLKFTMMIMAGEALHICVGAALYQPVERHSKRVPVENKKPPKPFSIPRFLDDRLVFTEVDGDVSRRLQRSPVVLTRMVHRQPSWMRNPNRVTSALKLNVLNLEKERFPRPAWNSSSVSLSMNGSALTTPNNNSRRISLTRQMSLDINKDQKIDSVPEDGIYVITPAADKEENKERRDSFDSANFEPQLQRRRSSRLSQILRQASIPAADPTDRVPTTDNIIQEEEEEEEDDDTESTVPELFFLRRPVFYLMGITAASFFLILNMVGIIIPDFAREELEDGISLKEAALLLSIFSGTDFVSRFSLSWVWDLPFINRTYCHLFSCILCALSFCSFVFVTSYNMAIVSCICIGLTSGISGILVTVLFLQKIGRKGFGLALSMSCMFSGVIMLCCGSFVGMLKDRTGSYKATFVIVGCFCIVTAVTWLVSELTCLNKKLKDPNSSVRKN